MAMGQNGKTDGKNFENGKTDGKNFDKFYNFCRADAEE